MLYEQHVFTWLPLSHLMRMRAGGRSSSARSPAHIPIPCRGACAAAGAFANQGHPRGGGAGDPAPYLSLPPPKSPLLTYQILFPRPCFWFWSSPMETGEEATTVCRGSGRGEQVEAAGHHGGPMIRRLCRHVLRHLLHRCPSNRQAARRWWFLVFPPSIPVLNCRSSIC